VRGEGRGESRGFWVAPVHTRVSLLLPLHPFHCFHPIALPKQETQSGREEHKQHTHERGRSLTSSTGRWHCVFPRLNVQRPSLCVSLRLSLCFNEHLSTLRPIALARPQLRQAPTRAIPSYKTLLPGPPFYSFSFFVMPPLPYHQDLFPPRTS
jgi:hypothetical protein